MILCYTNKCSVSFMMFEEYIGPNETVLLSFKISLQWIIVNALLSSIIFGGLALVFQDIQPKAHADYLHHLQARFWDRLSF